MNTQLETTELVQLVERGAERSRAEVEAFEQFAKFVAELQMPRTLADYYGFTGAYLITNRWLQITLQASDQATPDATMLVFGTIQKVAQELREHGWSSSVGMELKASEASDYTKTMTAVLSMRRPFAGSAYQIDFDFFGLPEGPYCRLVEETVDVPAVPATTKTVMRVVCEEQEQLPSPALPSPALPEAAESRDHGVSANRSGRAEG